MTDRTLFRRRWVAAEPVSGRCRRSSTSADWRPRRNQVRRWSAEPCVQDSGRPGPGSSAGCGRRRPPRPHRSAWSTSASPTDTFPRVVGEPAPHAGVAVGLQLHGDRQLVLLRRAGLLRRADLALGAEQRLQVVARLVGHDVRLRVAALGPELLLQLLQEPDVDEDARSGGQ